MELKKNMVKRWRGIDVRILDVDSDPAARVWVCEVANPDKDHMVPRTELEDADDDLHCDHADGLCRKTIGNACDEPQPRTYPVINGQGKTVHVTVPEKE